MTITTTCLLIHIHLLFILLRYVILLPFLVFFFIIRLLIKCVVRSCPGAGISSGSHLICTAAMIAHKRPRACWKRLATRDFVTVIVAFDRAATQKIVFHLETRLTQWVVIWHWQCAAVHVPVNCSCFPLLSLGSSECCTTVNEARLVTICAVKECAGILSFHRFLLGRLGG